MAVYALAAAALGEPTPVRSLDWLIRTTYDPDDGGIRDTPEPSSEKYTNVAGFVLLGLLEFPAFE
jgi:hypothetical protein